MVMHNYMEHVVQDALAKVIKQVKDACTCERCREDMMAWVLNRLPAKYVVSDAGHVHTKLHQMRAQSKTDLTVLLMEAVKVVKKHPRH